jgi:hypothetical protein
MSQAQARPEEKSLPTRSLRELGLACERLRVVEIGFGAAAWLRVTPAATGVRVLARRSDEARALRIEETGQVPEILLENRGPAPLLVPAHLVLAGGWQTRAVERSVVVASGVSARVPVKCVEAGRWAPRDDKTAATFEVADRTAVRTRWSASSSMAEQLRFSGRFAAEQAAIWQHVDEELARTPAGSRTRSYEAYLRAVQDPFLAEVHRAGVRAPAGANAVVILPRGGGYWLEAYPTEGALALAADGLLADLFDPDLKGDGHGSRLADLDALLDEIWAAPLRPLDALPDTAGEAFAWSGEQRDPQGPPAPAGAAVLVGGAVAHVGVGAPAARSTTASGISATSAASHVSSGDEPADRPRVDTDTMRAVFGRARDLMPEEPPARERVQGYRLVRVLERNVSWVDIRIGGDGYAVLGSHDRCDLVLGSDSGIWLRHLAAICVRLDDDTVGLRLIDLKTDLPFFLDDATPRWSVIASGPFAMRIGRHVVCGFPIGPLTGDEPLPPPPPSPRDAAARRAADTQATNVLDTALSLSSVSLPAMGSSARPANELASVVPAAPVSQIQDLVAPGPSVAHVRVTLERGGMGASVELPAEALDNGILLGRALNCFDGGLRRIFCEAISRAHVLVLRDQGDVFAFDLCSTNGTRVGGQRIRRHRLLDAGTTLEMGKKVVFRWRR